MQKSAGISKSLTLGKKERLKSRKLIERVFREGKSFALFPFRVYYLPVSGPQPGYPIQAGFSASSRNFKKAVDRNRIKRLMREAYRLQKDTLPQNRELTDLPSEKKGCFAVFFIYTGKDLPDYQTVYGKIGLTLQKLKKQFGG